MIFKNLFVLNETKMNIFNDKRYMIHKEDRHHKPLDILTKEERYINQNQKKHKRKNI